MFPPAWQKPNFRLADFSEQELAAMQRPYPACPLLLVVVYDPAQRAPASEGDFLGIISLGCAMENMWIMANSLGIGFHILSSLASQPTEKEVRSILNIPAKLKIAYSCRLGYPKGEPPAMPRVRRNIADFVHYNKW